MEQEIMNNAELNRYLIIAITTLVTAIVALVGGIVVMWKFQSGKMTSVIEENTKSSMLVSDGLSKVSEVLKELKAVVAENTKGFNEMEKTNLILSEQIKHI